VHPALSALRPGPDDEPPEGPCSFHNVRTILDGARDDGARDDGAVSLPGSVPEDATTT